MNIPISVSDITYERFIELKKVDQAFLQEPTIEKLMQVSKFWHGHDVTMGDIPEPTFMYNIGDEVTHARTYYHVLNLINSYEPQLTKTFQHKGKTWYVNPVVSDKMTVNEYIISAECQRRLNEIIESDEKRDLEGQFEFSFNLKQFAALCRLKGENIPIDKNERDKWLNERMKVFEDIPMNVVLDVNAFFLSTISDYGKTMNLPLFSEGSQNIPQNKMHKQQRQRVVIKNTGKRFGNALGLIRYIQNLFRWVSRGLNFRK